LRRVPASPSRAEVGRAQLEDEPAQLGQGLAGEPLCAGELLARRRHVAVQQRARGLGGEREREELLGDDVVQLERQAVALGEDRQLAAALGQPGVRDRDRRVGGEELDDLEVVVANASPSTLSVR
jgi:hypothetical protein